MAAGGRHAAFQLLFPGSLLALMRAFTSCHAYQHSQRDQAVTAPPITHIHRSNGARSLHKRSRLGRIGPRGSPITPNSAQRIAAHATRPRTQGDQDSIGCVVPEPCS